MADYTSWLLFFAGLVNQSGRVMIPAIKTSVMADADFGPTFTANVGKLLSGVSIVCLSGKILGGAVTDRLGGWTVLIGIFAVWIVATLGAITAASVSIFGAMWLLNSLAYTMTWGAQVQVIAATYSDADRPAQLSKAASSSRVGATLGNIAFGSLLSAGLHWRTALMPMVPLQVVLGVLCAISATSASAKRGGKAAQKKGGAGGASGAPGLTLGQAVLSLDFWLMILPKAVLFTYTQFFMNYLPQLLHSAYGFSHGSAASLGGIAQGGSVIGLLVVGNMVYKSMDKRNQVYLVAALLVVCVAAPATLAVAPSLPFDVTPAVVPLAVVWGLVYALPFYLPPGEFAMAIGGSNRSGLYANLFDAAGFVVSAMWNPWASASARNGDFRLVLLSQAVFGAISLVCMPLCMYRQTAKAAADKKAK